MNGRICPECNVRTTDENCPRCGSRTIRDRRSDVMHDPLLGRVLEGRYRIDATVGRGGMGAVYQGLQLSTQQVVAIKLIRAEQAEDIEAAKRFHREARAASLLKHPHTIRVFDFGESESGDLYMVLEFLAGRTLSKVMRAKGALPEARVAKIACEVAQSLAEAHAAGLAHRDLKPDNIMLVDSFGDPDFVKVLDFGIAKFLTSRFDDSNVTRTGAVVGTPYYTAPEQARGKPPTPAVDVYSLGIIVYEALSAMRPYDAPSPLDILVQHVRMPVPELPASYDAGRETRDILRRMLAKDPLERPSAAEVARTFERIRILCQAREVSGDWGPPPSAPPPAVTTDSLAVDPCTYPTSPNGMAKVEPAAGASADETGSRTRGRFVLVAVVIAAVTALAGAGAWLATRGPETSQALVRGVEAATADVALDGETAHSFDAPSMPDTPPPEAHALPDVRVAAPAPAPVHFASEPAGAQVLVDGLPLCRTPCSAAIGEGAGRRAFTFRLDGFRDAVVESDTAAGRTIQARLERAAPIRKPSTAPAPGPASPGRKPGREGRLVLPIED